MALQKLMATLATMVLFGSGAATAALADTPPTTTEPTTSTETTTTTEATTTTETDDDHDEHGDDDYPCGDHDDDGAAEVDNYRLVTASEGGS